MKKDLCRLIDWQDGWMEERFAATFREQFGPSPFNLQPLTPWMFSDFTVEIRCKSAAVAGDSVYFSPFSCLLSRIVSPLSSYLPWNLLWNIHGKRTFKRHQHVGLNQYLEIFSDKTNTALLIWDKHISLVTLWMRRWSWQQQYNLDHQSITRGGAGTSTPMSDGIFST